MVKIIKKKEMDLLELIKYILENNIKEKVFEIHNDENGYWERAVDVNKFGRINFVYGENGNFTLNDKFSVIVEEEVTEETKIPILLEIYSDCEGNENADGNITINDSIADCYDSHSLAFHILHSDGDTTLLWTKDKGMVE